MFDDVFFWEMVSFFFWNNGISLMRVALHINSRNYHRHLSKLGFLKQQKRGYCQPKVGFGGGAPNAGS